MRRWLGLGMLAVLLLAAAVLLYPVEGQIWRVSQVQRIALVQGDARSESGAQAAITEAVNAARQDRFRRVLVPLTGGRCFPTDVAFLTASGWVPTRIACPGGFFLDFMPRPGRGRL